MIPSEYKIVFLGAPGAGKTTCISALSDTPVICTDVATDELAGRKPTTTVAFDYGEVDIPDAGRLLLYGLPGQERFRFMFDVVKHGLVGTVLLVDASDADAIEGLDGTLRCYGEEIRRLPCTVVLNKCINPDQRPLRAEVAGLLEKWRIVAPVHALDARDPIACRRMFSLMMMMIEMGERADLIPPIQETT